MKKIILVALVSISSLMANDIDIEITDILNNSGDVKIGLYDKADNFSKIDKVYKEAIVKISSKTLKYKFTNISNGTYAIAIFHDENQNGKIDKNILRMPQEGYGFSNNIRPLLRSANFEESKFELNGNKNIVIKMEY